MKKLLSVLLTLLTLIGIVSVAAVPASAASVPPVQYQAHCQDYGWLGAVKNGATAGTTGKAKRLEAFTVSILGEPDTVRYSSHVSDIGWMSEVRNGKVSGTTGRSKQIEAVKIRLTGSTATKYDIIYRVHMADIGWGPWAINGEIAGTTGQSRRVEAIQIKLVAKGSFKTIVNPVPAGCYFNKKTLDKGKNWTGYHDININVSKSTPVYAIADGKVTYKQSYAVIGGSKYLISYGNQIEFTSADGVYKIIYAHLDRFNGVSQIIPTSRTKKLSNSEAKGNYYATGSDICGKAKTSVKAGQVLGYIGTTGNSTGIHLHIEVYKNGVRVDPTTVFKGLTR